MNKIGIYVHIPFCKNKCKYCDFTSFSGMEEYWEEYVKYLLKEIKEKSKQNKINFESGIEELIQVNTIYIGGGTPSILPERYIEKILKQIKESFIIDENVEITIEINPGTVTEEKFKKYLELGINRISIGLQSVQNNLLSLIGRIHTYEDFEEVYNLARKQGFKNINVDLMIGLPTQTLEDVKNSLNKIIEKNPEHISVYSLIVEENTKIFDLIENGTLKLPDENIERQMYWEVKEILQKNGYMHYEISNFAKQGYESKHNWNCWEQCSYLGFGVAAHSYFNGIRYSNIDNLKQYIENYKNDQEIYNLVYHEKQEKEDMMKEYMLLGLRKIEGVKISKFKEKFVDNPIYVFRKELDKLVSNDLVEIEEDYIKLTNKGIDLANQVWMEFC